MTDRPDTRITRRLMLGGSLAILAAPALGKTAPVKMTTYRSPSCGCCIKWIDAAKAEGFDVTVVPTRDMRAVKAEHGVPDSVLSCHTTIVGNYVVEGHVPLNAVKRMLAQKIRAKGIGVAGMPAGSPGMEVPGGAKEAFDILAFNADGKTWLFAKG